MHEEIPDDIKEARELLETFEKSIDHLKRSRDFEDAFNILDDHIAANPVSPYKVYIKNLKSTYIRIRLKQLSKSKDIDYYDWLHYVVLIAEIGKEIANATRENKILNKYREDFISLWFDKLIKAAEEFKDEI